MNDTGQRLNNTGFTENGHVTDNTALPLGDLGDPYKSLEIRDYTNARCPRSHNLWGLSEISMSSLDRIFVSGCTYQTASDKNQNDNIYVSLICNLHC